jgi:hypothetical protein
MCWLFCVTYIFCCIFPFDCCAKTEEEEEKGGERNFSGVAVWWCCGFLSHTCQVHPTPRYTTQAGERERERKEEEKIRVETTPFSQILFQRIFIFHFLTTVTHTHKQVTLATIGRPDSSETRNNFVIFSLPQVN